MTTMTDQKEPKESSEIKKKDFLDSIYFNDNGKAGSFSSFRPLYLKAKKLNSKITVKDVKIYLQSVRAYVRHKRILRRFKHRSFLTFYPDQYWQADVIYLTPMSIVMNRKNTSQKYGLTVIDTFTKFGWIELIRKKTADECLKAFQKIADRAKKLPSLTQVDEGKEFSGVFSKWCRKQNINLYSTHTIMQKAQICENFNYQLKLILNRILTHHQSKDFAKYIQQACAIYNNQISNGLPKLSPSDARKPENISAIQTFLFKKRAEEAKKQSKQSLESGFLVGEKVRKLEKYNRFSSRGFSPRFSQEIFTISSISNSIPRLYHLKGEGKKSYYKQQLNKVVERNESKSSIESISDDKQVVLTRLRSGKALTKIRKFLCLVSNEDKRRYLSESEILTFPNGRLMLEKYLKTQNGG